MDTATKKDNNTPQIYNKNSRRGHSRRVWLPAANGVTRNKAIIDTDCDT